MSELENRIVLITGASSGIGEATARRFSRTGARLILAARRFNRLERVAEELPVDCHLLQLDVRNREAVESSLSSLPADWQDIEILVNNAGLARGMNKLHEGSHADWEEMIDTNLKGLLYVSRAVIPGMVRRGRGHVINIGSIAGHEVYPDGNVYCATKHGVAALSKGMTMDLVDTPIRVSCVDPGLVETEFSLVRFSGNAERAGKIYEGYTPLTGVDIAEAVVWVASRPAHVVVADIIILPKAQASTMVIHKSG